MKKELEDAQGCPYCHNKIVIPTPELGNHWTTCPKCKATIQGVRKRKAKKQEAKK